MGGLERRAQRPGYDVAVVVATKRDQDATVQRQPTKTRRSLHPLIPSSPFHRSSERIDMTVQQNPWGPVRQKPGASKAHVTPRRCRFKDLAPGQQERPCYVYLLVHATENRYKIGRSIQPLSRAKGLPEYEHLSMHSSLVAQFPSTGRAVEVESSLHRALAGFRLHVEGSLVGRWDGGTEWFAMGSLSHAVNLLSCTPQEGVDSPDTKVYPALGTGKGIPVRSPRHGELRSQSLRVKAEIANERSMQTIVQTLKVLRERLEICWYPALPPSVDAEGHTQPGQKECVRIYGLRRLWTEDCLSARFDVASSDFWMFQTGRHNKLDQRRSWITQINFCPFHPSTLELWVEDRAVLKRLPAAQRLLTIWEGVCEFE